MLRFFLGEKVYILFRNKGNYLVPRRIEAILYEAGHILGSNSKHKANPQLVGPPHYPICFWYTPTFKQDGCPQKERHPEEKPSTLVDINLLNDVYQKAHQTISTCAWSHLGTEPRAPGSACIFDWALMEQRVAERLLQKAVLLEPVLQPFPFRGEALGMLVIGVIRMSYKHSPS